MKINAPTSEKPPVHLRTTDEMMAEFTLWDVSHHQSPVMIADMVEEVEVIMTFLRRQTFQAPIRRDY